MRSPKSNEICAQTNHVTFFFYFFRRIEHSHDHALCGWTDWTFDPWRLIPCEMVRRRFTMVYIETNMQTWMQANWVPCMLHVQQRIYQVLNRRVPTSTYDCAHFVRAFNLWLRCKCPFIEYISINANHLVNDRAAIGHYISVMPPNVGYACGFFHFN